MVAIRQTACHNGSNQIWDLAPHGQFQIRTRVNSGKCLDYYNGALRQYPCASYSTQFYRLTRGVY